VVLTVVLWKVLVSWMWSCIPVDVARDGCALCCHVYLLFTVLPPPGVAYSYTKSLRSVLHYHPQWLACALICPHPPNLPYVSVRLFLSQH
jgi:hypothetical protein